LWWTQDVGAEMCKKRKKDFSHILGIQLNGDMRTSEQFDFGFLFFGLCKICNWNSFCPTINPASVCLSIPESVLRASTTLTKFASFLNEWILMDFYLYKKCVYKPRTTLHSPSQRDLAYPCHTP
jgi:hypothetical protein